MSQLGLVPLNVPPPAPETIRMAQYQAVGDMRASDASKLREDVKNIALDAKARAQFLRKEKSMTIKEVLEIVIEKPQAKMNRLLQIAEDETDKKGVCMKVTQQNLEEVVLLLENRKGRKREGLYALEAEARNIGRTEMVLAKTRAWLQGKLGMQEDPLPGSAKGYTLPLRATWTAKSMTVRIKSRALNLEELAKAATEGPIAPWKPTQAGGGAPPGPTGGVAGKAVPAPPIENEAASNTPTGEQDDIASVLSNGSRSEGTAQSEHGSVGEGAQNPEAQVVETQPSPKRARLEEEGEASPGASEGLDTGGSGMDLEGETPGMDLEGETPVMAGDHRGLPSPEPYGVTREDAIETSAAEEKPAEDAGEDLPAVGGNTEEEPMEAEGGLPALGGGQDEQPAAAQSAAPEGGASKKSSSSSSSSSSESELEDDGEEV